MGICTNSDVSGPRNCAHFNKGTMTVVVQLSQKQISGVTWSLLAAPTNNWGWIDISQIIATRLGFHWIVYGGLPSTIVFVPKQFSNLFWKLFISALLGGGGVDRDDT